MEPEMKPLVVLRLSYDLPAIESMLRNSAVIVSPALPDIFDPYGPADYIVQRRLHDVRSEFLLDLNALIAIVKALEPGGPATPNERLAAAVMTLANLAEINIEPTMAVHEPLAENGDGDYRRRIQQLWQLSHVDSERWAAIALGQADRLVPSDLKDVPDRPIPPPTPGQSRSYSVSYTAALKLGLIALDRGDAKNLKADAFEEFLEWSYSQFMFSGPAVAYGSLFLCDKRKRDMFKKLRSGDADLAVRGVRNAAYDLALLSRWVKDVQVKRATFLVSFDAALRDSACDLVRVGEHDGEDPLRLRFHRQWGKNDGERCYRLYQDLASRKDSPARPANQNLGPGYWTKFTTDLEAEFREAARARANDQPLTNDEAPPPPA